MENNNNTQEEFLAAAKAKGIPEKYAKRYYTEGTDNDKALLELENEWTELKQMALGLPISQNQNDEKYTADKAVKKFTEQQNKLNNGL